MALGLLALALGGCLGPMHDGRRAMVRGEFEVAARHFRQAAEEHPDDPHP
ncbi:MAG: hypothetical protein AB7P00_37410 [Sandaracinaceae bacterium]